MRAAVVIPSNRELDDELLDNLTGADVFIVDGGGFKVRPGQGRRLEVLGLELQEEVMGEDLDLIGRGAAALRNFGVLFAHREMYDAIITLDDDCYPLSSQFVEEYIDLLTEPKVTTVLESDDGWVTTLQSEPLRFPRGFPYEPRRYHRERSVEQLLVPVVQVGLWRGTQDLNAVDKLTYTSPLHVGHHRYATSQMTSVCGMNFGCLREWAPFVYQVPWATFAPTLGLERYDDIIGGLVTCAMARMEEREVGFGPPLIDHRKKDTDLLTHAWRENLGNVYIGRLANLFMDAARIWEGFEMQRVERAHRFLESAEDLAEGDACEEVVRYCVTMYRRWLGCFTG